MGRSRLTPAARRLRAASTDAERKMWRRLQAKHLGGFKFRRQLPIGPYVVDFACLAAGLVVEVDGGQHADNPADTERDAWLRGQGFRVLRFWNSDVLCNLDGVLATIAAALSPSPQPSAVEGEGARRGRRPRRQVADTVSAPELDCPSLDRSGQRETADTVSARGIGSPSLDGRGQGGG